MTYETVVEAGQDIYDICIQEYGSILPIDTMLKDNSLMLDSDLIVGQKINIRKEPGADLVPDQTAMLLMRNSQTRIASSSPLIGTGILTSVHDDDHNTDHS